MEEEKQISETYIRAEITKVRTEYGGWTSVNNRKQKINSSSDTARRTEQKFLTE